MPNSSSRRQHPSLVALGDALRRRLEHGISQEELAFRAQVDRNYVGRVERGDNDVAILTLLKLAHALELTMKELMDEAKL